MLIQGKSPTFDNDILALIFNGTTILSGDGTHNLAENPITLPLVNLYISLHYANPFGTAITGSLGTQNCNEATYTGGSGSYARVAVPRTNSYWTVSGGTCVVATTIVWPQANATDPSGQPMNYFAIGTQASGASKILYFGPITPAITVASGVTPSITTSSTITES